MTGSCTEVPSRKFLICIEIWQVELKDGVWRESFHKYAYVHGDPIQGIDPTGQFLGFLIGVGLQAFGFAEELLAGSAITAMLTTAGSYSLALRDAGVYLIAEGEFDDGFDLFNKGSYLASITFDAIEKVVDGIGLASLATAGGFAIAKLAKHADKVPGLIKSLSTAGRSALKSGIKSGQFGRIGTRAGAEALEIRAKQIHQAGNMSPDQRTVAVIKIRNTETGQEKTLVSWNGVGTPPKTRLGNDVTTSDEIRVKGYGYSEDGFHSEVNAALHVKDMNTKETVGQWVFVEGGTNNNVCQGVCKPMLEGMGATVDGRKFWLE